MLVRTNRRGDEDERLPLSGKAEKLPAWLSEDWPGPAAIGVSKAR